MALGRDGQRTDDDNDGTTGRSDGHRTTTATTRHDGTDEQRTGDVDETDDGTLGRTEGDDDGTETTGRTNDMYILLKLQIRRWNQYSKVLLCRPRDDLSVDAL